ncbi:N-acetylglucosamine-6-phosphate deacetylase [Listeria monocytogenes]|uniref:N-acetylglucosamine-6-phosphate deacetylase n=1 Tax=Listeria monocytogenes TaxID=1639 RepID=A0A823IU94_LISMN|nr:N-acetylglucosamine-6-phosphate deacetylase [Listeria monocytogenes]EAG9221499.1 N-acetylglucosamine-6-phosphate deacetylase [Listeria monocytogenes]EAG9353363.1 N-acetylglucosamine-6-phosphate deacetylase [Listeria monocytogenes]OET21220.1 N-acetylglucosamine-6-phosphate deacetylase [Listeria monocytogenes]OFG96734.1 N-acetylglucosamine-6-phosphate deacetylase [Listeria monocytogenes]RFQ30157.1 N-acetylglucosamine-6-phosphate deacetylase [Listeria monocytogenes]
MAVIKNVQIYKENELINATVITEGNLIKEVCSITPEKYSEETTFDGHGRLLIPGMIDVHIHGANNYDMMDGSTESIQAVSMACAKTGCTSFLVTSVSSSLEDLIQMIRQTKKVIGKEKGAKIAGIHLEGPYLNIEKKGMQNPAYLRHPNLKEMKKIFDEADGLIKMVTIAPELPGGIELIDFLKKRSVVVAIAHSNATYEEAQDAFEKGASHITHCFNAMPPIHHRAPGLVAAALENDSISVQAIVDGVHLHPGIVRLIHKIKGPDKMVLTTDALQAMGVGDGEYIFGGHQVTVKEGIARLKDGTLASSTVTMNKSLKLSNEFGIHLQDAIQMAASTPAAILGMNNFGRIEKGYIADLVLLDKNFEVLTTWIDGEIY